MSLRAWTRVVVLGLALIAATPLLWPAVGPLPAVAGLALLGLAAGCLALGGGGPPVTCWQIRYVLEDQELGRLDETLKFLAAKAGLVVLEANGQGLFLETPRPFDEYVEAQLPKALPEARVSRTGSSNNSSRTGAVYLCLGSPTSDLLRWAVGAAGRRIRVHIRRGPYATALARADGEAPPGRWLRLPARLWSRLPVWDELSAGVRLGSLFPTTGGCAVFSSRSPVLGLLPPSGYRPDEAGRNLGQTVDGRPLTLPAAATLFTVAAPPAFLARQVAEDLRRGLTAVVVSPRRRVLDLVRHQAGQEVACYWLDQENSRGSAHLAVVAAGQWDGTASRLETAVEAAEVFLADLGLDAGLPAVRDLSHALIYLLAASAQVTGRDFTIGDLYAVGQSAQVLRAFLADLQELPDLGQEGRRHHQELQQQLSGDAGYVQAVSVLGAIRAALAPLKAASLYTLCQPPFLDLGRALAGNSLILAPMTNAAYPEHNRFVAAMLDLVVRQALAAPGDGPRLALHLHDPGLYRADAGRRWIDAARQDGRLALVVDSHDPAAYGRTGQEGEAGELFFRCSEELAAALVGEWGLACPTSDLTDLPPGMALARLAGMPVAVKTGTDR